MSGVIDVLADDARKLLFFLGLALLFLGGGIDVDIVSVIGLVVMLGALFVADTVESALRAYAEEESEATTAADPVEELRQRYARGELSEAEFERKLERLLETEDLEVGTSAAPESELES